MVDQIVDLMEAGMPVSSDTEAVAAAVGGAAGLEAGRRGAVLELDGVNGRLADEQAARRAFDARLESADRALSARVDQLLKAPPAGGSGDEVRDARVDWHGGSHANLGDAVRSQTRGNADSLGMTGLPALDLSMDSRHVLDNVPVHKGRNFSFSGDNGTVDNFGSHLMDSAIASISNPIRVRDPDGHPLLRNLYVMGVSTSDHVCAVCYGRDGSYLRPIRANALPSPLVGDDVHWMALVEYSNYPQQRWTLTARNLEWLNRSHMDEPTLPAPMDVEVTTRDPFDSAETMPGMIVDVADGPACTVDDWRDHLKAAGNATITGPIRVRYRNGSPVWPLMCLTGQQADDVRGYLYYGFDRDGRLLGRYDLANWKRHRGFDPDVHYACLIAYKDVDRAWDVGSMRLDWLRAGGDEREYTVGTGGDWTSLTACLRALAGDTSSKTIRILPGEYDVFSELGGKDRWGSYRGSDNWRDVQPVVPPNTRLTGVGQVTLRMTPSKDEISQKASTLLSPLNVSGTCTIENLRIVARNCRYAIHDECSGRAEFDGSTHTYRNITCEKQAPDAGWGYAQTIGSGEPRNGSILFEDCEIRGASPYTIHTNVNQAGDRTLLTFRHCLIEGGAGQAVGLSTSWNNLAENHARFDSCHLVGAIRTYNEQSDSDKPNSWRITMLNCNKDAQVTHTNVNMLQPTILNPIG